MRVIRTALLVALAFALAACFEGDPEFTEGEQVPEEERAALENGDEGDGADDADADAGGGTTATFVAEDIEFTDAPDEVPAGTVEFELENDGAAVHNVTLDDLGDEMVVEAQGGETATGSIELDPGTYEYHCDVPGHEDLMRGTFEVTE